MRNSPAFDKLVRAAIMPAREAAWRAGRPGGPLYPKVDPKRTPGAPDDYVYTPGQSASGATAPGATDTDAAYWAEQARGSLPAPIGAWAAEAIERCVRTTTKSKKLIPSAAACERLEKIGQSPEWAALPPTRQSLAITLLVDGAGLFPGVITAALGRPGKPPQPLPQSDDDDPDSLADFGTIEPAHPIAAGVLFAGRLGLIHGPAGGGKTTVLANVIARVTVGRPWCGAAVRGGLAVVLCEDPATWVHTVTVAGGDLRRVKFARWSTLPAKVDKYRPVAVVVDTLQFVAHQTGSAELDSAQAVDAILRPLERLCRTYDCAIIVTDHEPWADATAPGRDKESGTQKRPRHSGAKVATADYILRVTTTADGVTTITRGAKVRWGIAVESAISVDIRGEPAAGPAPAAETGGAVSGMDGSTVLTDTGQYDRVLGFLLQHDGATKTQIRDGLKMRGRKSTALDRVLDQAVAAGRIERQAGPRNRVRHCVVPPPETLPPRNGGTDLSRSVRSANGNGGGTTPEPVPGTGSTPYRERLAERTCGTGSAGAQAERTLPCEDFQPGALNDPDDGDDHGLPTPDRPAENPATTPPPEVQIMPDDDPPITRPPDGDPPAPDGRGQYVGILPANPAVTHRPDCPRCFGTGRTAIGAPCLDCQPLAVYIDRTRPLSADALVSATAYMDRLRAAASNGKADEPA